ncbi:hypothetical protein ACFVYA_02810 [Amycolatopsis sp. NPDC058278]|uniref:hypothetical protein n=1 Tax=Amycolatopsis sp. NPDC058278 TaxID=3346417 RepID=UPI0036DCDE47
MADPPRRKVSLAGLPGWVRYPLAAAVAAAIGAAAWFWGGRPGAPGWYQTGIRVAAVLLIGWAVLVVLRTLLRRWRSGR